MDPSRQHEGILARDSPDNPLAVEYRTIVGDSMNTEKFYE